MLSNLWASVVEDPGIAALLVVGVLCVSSIAVAVYTAVKEARHARVVTAAELRRDAVTAERRTHLQLMQRRVEQRRKELP